MAILLKEAIRYYLARRHLNPYGLSKLSGVREGTISKILSGSTRSPGALVLERLAVIGFRVPLSTLIKRAEMLHEQIAKS